MSKIKVMDEILANKIAAGEVIEKCVSIVKELVENSIDANATDIKIDLIESGVKEIKVTDNGSGMDKEDALLAFQRHASSKLTTDEDLYKIKTLGFRGEALPSIASVSEISIKTSDQNNGTLINIKGGKVISHVSSDLRSGTIIAVKNLFYNTPARLKHLSSLYNELANIIEYVNKIALAYPEIKFTLTNDNKKIFYTDGSNNLLKVINSIYGLEVTKKMLAIKNSNDDYDIEGYISLPEITRSNRNHIITLINNRVVRNQELNKAINDAYHNYKADDRYPIIILKITTDPSIVDVNIHPTKMDVKFGKKEELFELVKETIITKLQSISLIPKVEYKEPAINYEIPTLDLERYIIPDQPILKVDMPNMDTSKLIELYPIGIALGTYIIAQNETGIYLIDQHAAKERINYEKYVKELGNPKPLTTKMLIPFTLELPNNEYLILNENLDILTKMGFNIQEMGINTITVKEHPLWLPINNVEEATRRIIEIILEKEKNFSIEKFNEKVATNLSCKMSIKANTNISTMEMEQLINDLRACINPYNCPHGRPTIIEYSIYELEKLFKRSI
ncbi:MAG: DNA mismatch repair endonuclease MutL [Dehalococcoidales bacterium]|nr:DNA mismatch repair endonuclease MutL [Dehalococcoidales bacterium]